VEFQEIPRIETEVVPYYVLYSASKTGNFCP